MQGDNLFVDQDFDQTKASGFQEVVQADGKLPKKPKEVTEANKAARNLEYSTNWSGNVVYQSGDPHFVRSIDELRNVVLQNEKVKVLGSRHCFNRIGDTDSEHVVIRDMKQILDINPEKMTVTVEAGILYGELGKSLHRAGFAIANLASLPHISIAGACATATHGSGDQNGCLATSVIEIEMMMPNGELVTYNRDHKDFYGVVVGLGATGIATKLTLMIEPTFMVRQDVYEHLPIQELYDHFDAITGSAYSVSLFTDWQSDSINQVWLKRKAEAGSTHKAPREFFGATRAARKLHPIIENDPENCTPQQGIPGHWYKRLSHFLFDKNPSNGSELQSEYILPRANALEAIRRIQSLSPQLKDVLLISEIRTIAADDFWMSPAYKQDSIGIHFTWQNNWERVQEVLPYVEAALMELGARPHWGKIFSEQPQNMEVIRGRYPMLDAFRDLVGKNDPNGKFKNEFLEKLLGE